MAQRIMSEAAGQVLANKIKTNITNIAANTAAIAALQANAYDDTALSARVTANETAITTLNGTGEGSVDKKVADKIAEVVASAPADFDTLKEISDWISSHTTDAAAMNSKITANETAIAALQAGTLTVDVALSASSENPVQNKAVSAAITTLQTAVQNLEDNALEVDTALSTTSENPVQNKAVKAAIDEVAALYELVSATDAEGWFTTTTP